MDQIARARKILSFQTLCRTGLSMKHSLAQIKWICPSMLVGSPQTYLTGMFNFCIKKYEGEQIESKQKKIYMKVFTLDWNKKGRVQQKQIK